jgi:hypothetical protein
LAEAPPSIAAHSITAHSITAADNLKITGPTHPLIAIKIHEQRLNLLDEKINSLAQGGSATNVITATNVSTATNVIKTVTEDPAIKVLEKRIKALEEMNVKLQQFVNMSIHKLSVGMSAAMIKINKAAAQAPLAEPVPEPVPASEPVPEPVPASVEPVPASEPEPVTLSVSEPEPASEPLSEPVTLAVSEPEPASEPVPVTLDYNVVA